MSASKPYAHAQYGKLVLVVVLVFWSKGPYYGGDEDDVEESSKTQNDVTRCVTCRFDRTIQIPFLREK